MSTDHNERDDSGVRLPPPLYFIGGFALGLLLERVVPLRPRYSTNARLPTGGALIAAGLALIVWAIRAMRRANTSPEPWEPTTAIVTDGPFRFTRNPIYLGDALVHLGASVMAGRLWPVALLPAAMALLQRRVVRKEEQYLERKFGEEYLAYRRRVGRWV